MENNLAIQELAAINEIDLGLKKLKEIFKSKEPYQPIDTTEGEYVRCVKSVLMFEEGHIYKLSDISENNIEHFVMCRNGIQQCSYEQYRMFFYPATHAEFLAQEQGKELAPIETEQRWKVEVVRTITDDCGIYITRKPPLRKLKARELQEAIKQYLSTNKF
jgi:hypothetical protein